MRYNLIRNLTKTVRITDIFQRKKCRACATPYPLLLLSILLTIFFICLRFKCLKLFIYILFEASNEFVSEFGLELLFRFFFVFGRTVSHRCWNIEVLQEIFFWNTVKTLLKKNLKIFHMQFMTHNGQSRLLTQSLTRSFAPSHSYSYST